MADRNERWVLNHLIPMCRDEELTLRHAADHVKDPSVKELFASSRCSARSSWRTCCRTRSGSVVAPRPRTAPLVGACEPSCRTDRSQFSPEGKMNFHLRVRY